jgi:hyaluronoglucosaminidase
VSVRRTRCNGDSAVFPNLVGVIEGFYGRPWTEANRLEAASWMRQLGFNAYFYAPKSDAILRSRWQLPYSSADRAGLEALVKIYQKQGLHFGVGLSPLGINQSWTSEGKRALSDKLSQLVDLGVDFLGVFFDDMTGLSTDSVERQLDLLHRVRMQVDDMPLFACPSYYSDDPVLEEVFGPMPPGYIEDFGKALPTHTTPMWTGPEVCSNEINEEHLDAVVRRFGRPLALWDNYPVNDGRVRSNHLYIRPLSNRASRRDLVTAHFCNPMNQANLSVLGLIGLSTTHNLGSKVQLQAFASEFFGPELHSWLVGHAVEFEEAGLLGWPRAKRAAIKRSIPKGNPAAVNEVIDWLDDKYAFDPACLTDV